MDGSVLGLSNLFIIYSLFKFMVRGSGGMGWRVVRGISSFLFDDIIEASEIASYDEQINIAL